MLTAKQASAGLSHAVANAVTLFDAGQRHRRAGQLGLACSMYVLSAEESAKAFALAKRAEGIVDEPEITSVFRRHSSKHEIATGLVEILHQMLITAGRGHRKGCEILSEVQRWREVADRLKQRGLYVDWSEGQWQLPSEVSEQDFAIALFVCKSVLTAAKSLVLPEDAA